MHTDDFKECIDDVFHTPALRQVINFSKTSQGLFFQKIIL